MNTLEIIYALSKNKKTIIHFKGVYPSDCLPKKLKKPAFIIANTEGRHSPGQHWIGIYCPKNGKGQFFDSFGQAPTNKHFLKFLENNCTSFSYNKKRLKGDFSTTCGQWCCVYMYYKCMGKSLRQFLQMFGKNFEMNDNKVLHLYHKYLQVLYKKYTQLHKYAERWKEEAFTILYSMLQTKDEKLLNQYITFPRR